MSAAVHQIAAYTPRSPQLENGYLRIANELQEAISAADVTKRELKVLNVIIRMTYGFRKKEDDIAASQIGQSCRMGSSHVTEALNSLAKKNIITKRRGRIGCVVGIQKDYSLWPMDDMPVEYSKPKKPWARKEPKSSAPKLEVVSSAFSAEIPAEVLPKQELSPPDLGVSSPANSGDSKDSSSFKDSTKKTPWPTQASTGEFDAFWQAYPKKVKKEKALAAFRNLNPDHVLQKRILASIAEHEMTDQWQRGVIEQADTFLNDKMWTDELRIDYNDEQLHVMKTFNDLLGPVCGDVIDDVFRPNLADMIDVFLGFERDLPPKDGKDFCQRYFGYVAARCVLDNRPYVNFEWLIKRDNFGKVLARELEK